LEDGTTKKTYIPRSEEELKKFEDIVKKAMGYSEDREDQVSVSSIPFSDMISMDSNVEEEGLDVLRILGAYKKTIVNLFLVLLVFFLVVRPLLNGMKRITGETIFERAKLPSDTEEYAQIPELKDVSRKQKVLEVTKKSPEKTEQLLKGWIGEQE